MKNNLLYFLSFFIIGSIATYLKGETIAPYLSKDFELNNIDYVKIYYFYPKKKDLNHEIILQINSSYYGNAYLCTGYFKDESEENIYFNSINNAFINCQKSFNIRNIEYIEEYNITYDHYNSSNLSEINSYYFIALYINKNNWKEFTGTLTVLDISIDVIIDRSVLSKLIYYKNNYSSKNYSFSIYPYKINKKNLHIQISTLDDENKFDINFSKDNNDYLIENKTNISSYNNFFNISSEEKNYYKLKINFNTYNLENPQFAILFEYTSLNNRLMTLPDEVAEINFLTQSNYYFYQNITEKNNKLFYLIYDNLFKRSTTTTISFLQINNNEFNNIDYNIEFEKQINSSNFVNCIFRPIFSSLIAYKCINNINIKNESNAIIIRISSSGIYPLKIRNIQFKQLKRIIIDENEYNNRLFYHSFNSEHLINRFGYYYIPKSSNIMKRQLIFCSLSNTINLFLGDFDIIEQNLDISFDKDKLIKISHNDEDIPGYNYDGYTIITFNKDNNYFIQITDISKEIYDNFLIEAILEKDDINREITFDTPLQNYYIFFTNEFNEDFQSIIFDAQILYGNLDIKYIDIDLISENKFDLNKILLCDEENYLVKDAKHPISIRQTTEFIKITNHNYNLYYYYKAKFYINKYLIKDNRKLNTLSPIYLNPLESKLFSLENIYGNIQYYFKLGDNYNDFTNNREENLANIIIGYNNNYIFNLNINKYFIKGNITYINFGDTIKFVNNFNRSILIWSSLGLLSDQQDIIKTLYLSKNFYYLYTFSFSHRLCFDWFNIKKKMQYGLIPQKILISLLNEQQTKTNGYYYQVLSFEENNGNNHDNTDFFYCYSRINSINYELQKGESHTFLSGDINITLFDYYYKENSYINYMIYPLSGLATILFYVEYLYDLTSYMNYLKFLDFDDSIYSINLKLDNTYIKNRQIYENYNYIVFQCLSCGNIQPKISFKYNNISYSQENNFNNLVINSISVGNIVGYINFDFLNQNVSNYEIYLNIIKPYKIYVKYYFSNNVKTNYIYQNNYNINVEQKQNLGSNKNIFVVSFDCFLKNIKTNYTILLLNKNEAQNGINNECEFFNYLDNINDNKKYFSFIDNNDNIRIKKEISFEDYGNYAIYIMAQSLDSLSIYKYLGTESYSYTNILNNNNDKKGINISNDFIALIIFVLLLIILIVLFIVFRYVRKKKLIKLFSSYNNSFLSKELMSSENKSVKLNNINEINYIDISNCINNDESNSNSEENKIELFNKPKNDENKEEKINQEYKDLENKDSELNPDLLCRSPAPLLGNTFSSEEDKIRNELAKITQNSNKNNVDKNTDKIYYNTNDGKG